MNIKKIYSSNLDSFSEGDKLKYYQNGQTKQAFQPATGHPEAVGAAGSSVGVAEAIEAVEVLELWGGRVVEDTTHPIEFLFRLILCKNMDKNYFLQKFAEIFKKL